MNIDEDFKEICWTALTWLVSVLAFCVAVCVVLGVLYFSKWLFGGSA